MKKIVTGIVAHVDAGKTTLSKALLYQSGSLRQAGRVDKGDSFLDTSQMEKQRGITIFSHEAQLKSGQTDIALLDTPGHIDFAAQMEQVLQVLDYAILVISATDGIQGHTRMLWDLLKKYQLPVFIFVNKMDTPSADGPAMLSQLQELLDDGCLSFGDNQLDADTQENIALQDDQVLNAFLEKGKLDQQTIRQLIKKRKVFPVYLGSALKMEGTKNLLDGLDMWTESKKYRQEFGARVFKVTHDPKGERLTWVKMTGGSLRARTEVLPGQKINQLRSYNGEKFSLVQEAQAGDICTLTGLKDSYIGQGLGNQVDSGQPFIQPALDYALDLKENDLQTCLAALRQLEDEDPQLHVVWSKHLNEIHVQIMGKMQLDVLRQLLDQRFYLDVDFREGGVVYQETITKPVEGVGHFEPLRHYAEAHILLEPAERGSGLQYASDCSLEVLDKNIQHQVLTSMQSRENRGVLIGAPLADVKLTLVGGKASNVHTVGGDFRQATYRAIRQGLMEAQKSGSCQLLEPWYDFRLLVGQNQVGRAMTDIERMGGSFNPPEPRGNLALITGTAPVAEMKDYPEEVRAYTHGEGQLECLLGGYRPAHNASEVVASRDYDPVGDLEYTPDSVFCAHGAGYPVAWDEVPQKMHCLYYTSEPG